MIAQTDGIVDDLCEVWMTGGLAITGKSQYIRHLSLSRHFLQFLFQFLGHEFP